IQLVDHDHADHALLGFQLQAELLLKSNEERWATVLRICGRCEAIGCEGELIVVLMRKARGIINGPVHLIRESAAKLVDGLTGTGHGRIAGPGSAHGGTTADACSSEAERWRRFGIAWPGLVDVLLHFESALGDDKLEHRCFLLFAMKLHPEAFG